MKEDLRIHMTEGLKILSDKKPHNVRCYELSTGDILEYNNVQVTSGNKEKGIFRFLFPNGEMRSCRFISLIAVDNKKLFK